MADIEEIPLDQTENTENNQEIVEDNEEIVENIAKTLIAKENGMRVVPGNQQHRCQLPQGP